METGKNDLTVMWSDGRSEVFNYLWLRDNCVCPECREPSARERLYDTVSMPLDVHPSTVAFDGGLRIVWSDGHRTSFSERWLRESASWHSPHAAAPGVEIGWDSNVAASPPQITLAEIDAGPGGLRRWLELIRAYGFCLVRGVPTEIDAVVSLAERIAAVQPSNFGRSFQVVSKPDPENLAYTAHRLRAHSDIPNRYSVAKLQFLHCLEFSARGGESILVDGFAAAHRLSVNDPEAHELLSEVWAPWRYHDESVDIRNRFPVIRTDDGGRYVEVRFHTGLMAPLDLDPSLVGSFYRALIAFGTLLRDPAREYVFRMLPGDCQVFDNQRVLHARAAFDPNSGRRHLQGCYVDKDDFLGRLRCLERSAAVAH